MGIKALSAFLIVLSAYLAWWVLSTGSFVWLIPAAIFVGTAIGLLLSKRWGQYLWYVIAAVSALSWVASVIRVAVSGWPHDTALASFISLLPGLLLVTVCVGGSAIVAKHYASRKNAF